MLLKLHSEGQEVEKLQARLIDNLPREETRERRADGKAPRRENAGLRAADLISLGSVAGGRDGGGAGETAIRPARRQGGAFRAVRNSDERDQKGSRISITCWP